MKHLLTLFVAVSAILFQFSSANAQSPDKPDNSVPLSTPKHGEPPSEISTITARFYKLLIASQVDMAFEELLRNSDISQKKEPIQKLIEQTKKTAEAYGEMKGYEFIKTDQLSPSFLRVQYLGLHVKFPMRWIISFYKSPTKGWLVTNIRFDDSTEEIFFGN